MKARRPHASLINPEVDSVGWEPMRRPDLAEVVEMYRHFVVGGVCPRPETLLLRPGVPTLPKAFAGARRSC